MQTNPMQQNRRSRNMDGLLEQSKEEDPTPSTFLQRRGSNQSSLESIHEEDENDDETGSSTGRSSILSSFGSGPVVAAGSVIETVIPFFGGKRAVSQEVKSAKSESFDDKAFTRPNLMKKASMMLFRTTKAVSVDKNDLDKVDITSAGHHDDDEERKTLTTLFQRTNGPNWVDSKNWFTSAELNAWKGVTIDNDGWVRVVVLSSNNLRGS